nr:ribonuclease H-like domain-containing protein [Tanacetum cinerariifolium]
MAVLGVAILFATFYVCLGVDSPGSIKSPPCLPDLTSQENFSVLGSMQLGKYTKWFNDVLSPKISTKCEDILNMLSEIHGCKVVEVVIPELHQLRTSHLLPVGSESLASLTPHCHDRNGIESAIKSGLLTREVLTEVKDAFVIVTKEESHRGIPATTTKTDKPQASVFVSRVNDVKRSNSHIIERCFEIIGYPHGLKRNSNLKVNRTFYNNRGNNADLKRNYMGPMTLKSLLVFYANVTLKGASYHFGWIIDSLANQHMINIIKNMIHVVDVIDKNLNVGHPNSTLAKITHIGNLRLNNNVILFDVLAILEYSASLLSVDKLIKDNFTNKTHIRPNHDDEDSPSRDCRVHQLVNGSETEQPGHDGDNSSIHDRVHQPVSEHVTKQPGYDGGSSATPLDETDISKGNVVLIEVLVFQNSLPSNTEEGGPRRSQRASKLPAKLNEYVLDTKDITDLPLNRIPIGCKWVYRIEYKSNGEVERYKARLVAKSFDQKEGIDYEETFCHVVKMTTVRCLINLAVQKHQNIYQVDVNNAFLYEDLNEEVYMVPPPGCFSSNETKTCRHVMTPSPENLVLGHKESDSDKFLSNITSFQILVALRVFKYLQLALVLGVNLSKRKGDCLVTAFFDFDWAKCHVT